MEETNWHELRRREKPETVKRRGIGIGCEMHGSSAYPGIKEQGNAIVKMNEDGTVTLITGTAGLGTGAHTALSQIVAEELGVPFEAVSVVQGDTDIVPWDIGAFASHTTYLGGRAAQLAAADVRRQVLEHAAPLLKAEPGDLAIRDGFVVVANGSNQSLRLSEAVGPQRGMNLITSPPACVIAGTT